MATISEVIFFGNGPLADFTLKTLKESKNIEVIFHARTREDLEEVKRIKSEHPTAFGVLASFGVIIKKDVLDLFEPTGILNIHPSLLPAYRGPSPIESAILNGDTSFSVSVMKLVEAMDAGPLYFQATLEKTDIKNHILRGQEFLNDPVFASTLKKSPITNPHDFNSPMFPSKQDLYFALSTTGATWIVDHLENLPSPAPQRDENATYTKKLTSTLSELNPSEKSSYALLNEIRAFSGFPKSKYTFSGHECIVLSAHISDKAETPLSLLCSDQKYLNIDFLQPAGRKAMDAKSFINGYVK